jgi:hypothetical protein
LISVSFWNQRNKKNLGRIKFCAQTIINFYRNRYFSPENAGRFPEKFLPLKKFSKSQFSPQKHRFPTPIPDTLNPIPTFRRLKVQQNALFPYFIPKSKI